MFALHFFIFKKNSLQTVYCITGLGADEQVFQFLDLSFVHPVFIKWISPFKHDTLSSYALRLKKEFIHEPNPVIIGLSLGGMLSVEIAKTLPSAKVIIISSAKTEDEIPPRLRLLRYIPLYKLLTATLVQKTRKSQEFFLGAHTSLARNYLRNKLRTIDLPFYKWAIGAIVNWRNKTVSKNIVHIHGRADRLLPFKFVKPDIIIDDGGHLMIVENAAAISTIIKKSITGTI